MASSGETAAPTSFVTVAVGTKRPRESEVPVSEAEGSGLDKWAAETKILLAGTADVLGAQVESGAHHSARRDKRLGTAQNDTSGEPSTSDRFVDVLPVSVNTGGPDTEPNATTKNATGTHTKLTPSSKPPSRKNRNACFRYGNYHRYYGYRVGETLEDHRVAHFQDEWFTGKRVVDIGCNEGLVGLSIAVRCAPASMLGVDIDNHLVKKAKDKLERLRRAAGKQAREVAKHAEKEKESPVGTALEGTEGGKKENPAEIDPATPSSASLSLAHAVAALKSSKFKCCNAVDEVFEENSCDAALCLSVTKWIQLNWGDAGLLKLFRNIFHALSPGGIFLVEPQPWRSYKQAFKKQNMPPETRAHFRDIKIKPSDYRGVLRDTIGFASVETLRDADLTAGTEFDRTVLLCVKGR